MKNFFTLFFLICLGASTYAQPNLPIDYEASIDYQITNFNGGELTVIANPDMTGINMSATVGQMVKNGGEPFGGAFMTLESPMDFENNNTFKVQVWSPEVGRKVLLKVENLFEPSIAFEQEVSTTSANEWEELTFDYSSIDASQSYQKLIFIMDNGTVGDGSANFTYYIDDIRLIQEAPSNELALPIDYEASIDYQITNFNGGELSVIANPDMSGINTSATVGRMVKNGGEPFGGAFMTLADPMDFENNNTFKVNVWSPAVGTKVLLKVENISEPGIFFEDEQESTVANTWEEISFDFTGADGSQSYQKLIFIFDNGTVGDGSPAFTYYLDDIRLVQEGPANELALPIDYEANIDYQITNFNGGDLTVIPNPDMSGINESMTVGRMVKNPGEVFGGAFMTLADPIDFDNNVFKMKVWSPEVGRTVLLKVENISEPGIAFEQTQTSTVANEWEELTFDYTGIDETQSFQKIILIFDNGTAGDGSANFTYYIDDIRLDEGMEIIKPELPLDFEDGVENYALRDFDGAVSTVIEDPTDMTNTVMQTVKTETAAFFAGTVLADFGLENPIPLTMDASIMSVRVWSPDAGIPVRLKVENSGDVTQSVETETMTTVAGEWEVLEFDFNNEVAGTAAFNPAFTYDKMVIFFNFGTTGEDAGEKTYYSDDYTFGVISSNEILNASAAGIKVGPNPASDFLTILLPSELSGNVQLQVFNTSGQIVNQMQLNGAQTEIPVAQLQAGTYILKFNTKQQSYVQRVMIAK